MEIKALETQINEFGQTPTQLFTHPHPPRMVCPPAPDPATVFDPPAATAAAALSSTAAAAGPPRSASGTRGGAHAAVGAQGGAAGGVAGSEAGVRALALALISTVIAAAASEYEDGGADAAAGEEGAAVSVPGAGDNVGQATAVVAATAASRGDGGDGGCASPPAELSRVQSAQGQGLKDPCVSAGAGATPPQPSQPSQPSHPAPAAAAAPPASPSGGLLGGLLKLGRYAQGLAPTTSATTPLSQLSQRAGSGGLPPPGASASSAPSAGSGGSGTGAPAPSSRQSSAANTDSGGLQPQPPATAHLGRLPDLAEILNAHSSPSLQPPPPGAGGTGAADATGWSARQAPHTASRSWGPGLPARLHAAGGTSQRRALLLPGERGEALGCVATWRGWGASQQGGDVQEQAYVYCGGTGGTLHVLAVPVTACGGICDGHTPLRATQLEGGRTDILCMGALHGVAPQAGPHGRGHGFGHSPYRHPLLLAGCHSRRVHAYCVETGAVVGSWAAHDDAVCCVALPGQPEGEGAHARPHPPSRILTSSWDCSIKV